MLQVSLAKLSFIGRLTAVNHVDICLYHGSDRTTRLALVLTTDEVEVGRRRNGSDVAHNLFAPIEVTGHNISSGSKMWGEHRRV